MGNLGWPEILTILVIALIIFGPRKLPELGKSLGQSLAQFRRASEDFKRTWEEEVEVEKRRLEAPPPTVTESREEIATAITDEEGQADGLEPEQAADVDETSTAIPTSEPTVPETKRDWM